MLSRRHRPYIFLAFLLLVAVLVTACAKGEGAAPSFTEPEAAPETTRTVSALEACESALAALRSREALALSTAQPQEDGTAIVTKTYLSGGNFLVLSTEGGAPVMSRVRVQGQSGWGTDGEAFIQDDSGYTPTILDRYDPAGKEITLPYGDRLEDGTFTFHALWNQDDGTWEGDVTYEFAPTGDVERLAFAGSRTFAGETAAFAFETLVLDTPPEAVYDAFAQAASAIRTPEEAEQARMEAKLVQEHPSNATEFDRSLLLGSSDMGWYFGGQMRLRLGAEDASPTGATLRYTAMEGLSALTADGAYFLERWEGERWVDVPRTGEAPAGSESLFSAPAPGSEKRLTLDWSASYGSLAPGHYRVGLYHTAKLTDGGEDTQICYAKFRIYGSEEALLDTCAQALAEIQAREAFHIRRTEWLTEENRNKAPEERYYYIEDTWRGGDGCLETIRYLLYEGGGDAGSQSALLRGGQGFRRQIRDGVDSGWTAASPEDLSFDGWSFFLEPTDALVSDVTREGDTVVIHQRVESLRSDAPRETQLRYEFDDAGALISVVSGRLNRDGGWEEDAKVEFLPVSPADAAAVITSVEVGK